MAKRRKTWEPPQRVNVKCRLLLIVVGIVVLALQAETSHHRLTLEMTAIARTLKDTPTSWEEETATPILEAGFNRSTVAVGVSIVHCNDGIQWDSQVPSQWEIQFYDRESVFCTSSDSSASRIHDNSTSSPGWCTSVFDFLNQHYYDDSTIAVFLSGNEIIPNLLEQINDMVDRQIPFLYLDGRLPEMGPVAPKDQVLQILSENNRDDATNTTVPSPASSSYRVSFAVSKSSVRANPQSLYQQWRNQIRSSEEETIELAQWRCETLEQLWHVLFQPSKNQHLPDPSLLSTTETNIRWSE